MNNKKELIKLYTDFITEQNSYAIEAEYINYQIKENLLDNVVDFGCNFGHLAKSVLDTNNNIVRYTGIDAVKLYLETATTIVNNEKFNTVGAFLIPPIIDNNNHPNAKISNNIYRKTKFFNVDITNILSTSSFYSLHDTKRVLLETESPIEIDDFVNNNLNLFNQSTYCKIDIDSSDCELVAAILNKTDIQCIQFEVSSVAYKQYINLDIFNLLHTAGFSLPNEDFYMDDYDISKDLFMLSTSKTAWWYAVAKHDGKDYNCRFVSSWGKTNLQHIKVVLD